MGSDTDNKQRAPDFATRDAAWFNYPSVNKPVKAHADRGGMFAACSGAPLVDETAGPASHWDPGQICRRRACQNAYVAAVPVEQGETDG